MCSMLACKFSKKKSIICTCSFHYYSVFTVNLCITDTLGEPTKSVLDYQGVLIFQVSLYDKAPFGTITKCVDYTGVLIFKYPD